MLFPYARARVGDFLRQNAGDPAVRADIELLAAEHARESPDPQDLPAPPAAWDPEAYVLWLMDLDRKSTGLKSLQGKIWEAGYRAGELAGRGEVYPDVAPALARWRNQGKTIAIFSSGSVQAQRNLFKHSTAGDLTPFLSGYFDTTTGAKREAESYRKIARLLARGAPEVLFISDVPAELDAARQAGMETRLCVRDSPAAPSGGHRVIRTFEEL